MNRLEDKLEEFLLKIKIKDVKERVDKYFNKKLEEIKHMEY